MKILAKTFVIVQYPAIVAETVKLVFEIFYRLLIYSIVIDDHLELNTDSFSQTTRRQVSSCELFYQWISIE